MSLFIFIDCFNIMRNRFGILLLLMTVSMHCLVSSAQVNSMDYLDIQLRLTESRNRDKPQGVSRGFKKLYKKVYGLSGVTLPFNSFTSFYPGFEAVLLHRNDYIGAWSYPIAMLSSDSACIAYIHVLSSYGEGWVNNNIQDVKLDLATDVMCNRNDVNYWQVKIKEDEIQKIFDENIKVYEDDELTAQCRADFLLLCNFPFREKICTYGKEGYVSIHEEYPHCCTLIIYRDKHIPIKMQLFVSDEGFDRIDDYLSDICKSIRFKR